MGAAGATAAGDVVVFLDADVANTTPAFVTSPPRVRCSPPSRYALVKGFYTHPLHGEPTGGGRVTELVARPVLELPLPRAVLGAPARWPARRQHRWVFEKLGFAGGTGWSWAS